MLAQADQTGQNLLPALETWVNEQAWVSCASGLSEHHRLGEPDARRALIEVDRLVSGAPTSLHDWFRDVGEDDVAFHAKQQLDDIEGGSFGWLPAVGDQSLGQRWFMAAASQARALDRFLLQSGPSHLGPPADTTEWLCAEEDVWVVPRRVAATELPRPGRGQTYSRRGLLHHRVLPAEVGGLRVAVTSVDGMLPEGRQVPLVLVSALFKGFQLRWHETTPGRFRATGTECLDPVGTIAAQLAAAEASGCLIVAWPELTIPSRIQSQIRVALQSWRTPGESVLPLLAAGSWHEEDDGRWFNQGCLFDRFGKVLLKYRKTRLFRGRDEPGTEDVEAGEELSVCVVDGVIMAIAICKDFCDLGLPNPYAELAADLVVVTSMGGAATMAGHINVAHQAKVRTGAPTFVVQQADPEETGGHLGYVLFPGADFTTLRPEHTKEARTCVRWP